MDSIEIKAIIKQGENSQVEFKECQDRISHSVYETVCSFLNYKGETPSLYSTYDPRERHKMLHFASRNTQHPLKTTSISTLFPQTLAQSK